MKVWENIGELTLREGARLAVVPARGGSKGIPRKCMATVGNSPLLVRAIRNCLAAKTVDRVILSTDDADFAEAGTAAGADVPFLRRPELADDTTSTIDVLDDLLKFLLDKDGELPEYLLLNQPTTPLLIPTDHDGAFSRFSTGVDAVCSVCESEVKPDWLRKIGERGYLTPLNELEVPQHVARQQMPVTYRLNGGLYWIRTQVFLTQCTLLPPKTVPYEIATNRSIDIDTPLDLTVANALFNELGLGDMD